MEIKDIFRDFQDGRMLIKLLECLTNKEIAKPKHFRMRIHKLDNINIALGFLRENYRVYYESIGAEDIVDGNLDNYIGFSNM